MATPTRTLLIFSTASSRDDVYREATQYVYFRAKRWMLKWGSFGRYTKRREITVRQHTAVTAMDPDQAF